MPQRGVVRLIVPSPDGRRVLARPNGLAGWALPTIAVDLPFDAWDDHASDRAQRLLSTTVAAGARVTADCWAVAATGRVPAAGNTWIDVGEADRFGADAGAVRAWAVARPDAGGAVDGGAGGDGRRSSHGGPGSG
jgi:hypothetical protein